MGVCEGLMGTIGGGREAGRWADDNRKHTFIKTQLLSKPNCSALTLSLAVIKIAPPCASRRQYDLLFLV